MRPRGKHLLRFRGSIALIGAGVLFFSGLMPAVAAGIDLCAKMHEEASYLHACCLAEETGADSPHSHQAKDHASHASHSAPAAKRAGSESVLAQRTGGGHDACSCQQGGNLPLPESETPATTVEVPSPRTITPHFVGTLCVGNPGLVPPSNAGRIPDEGRRRASSPPLFLMHDLLLI